MNPGSMSKSKHRADNERGQSLAEMAVMTPFLLILIIAAFEFTQAFVAYIGLINAAREGAIYAALHPELSDYTDLSNCSGDQTLCDNYVNRVKDEAVAVGLDVNPNLTVDPPVRKDSTQSSKGLNCPITTTVTYNLTTFSSNISLPLVGRFGLPNAYTIRYSVQMPIRESDVFSCPDGS